MTAQILRKRHSQFRSGIRNFYRYHQFSCVTYLQTSVVEINRVSMGAVHGCYLKYVGLSAISYAGYQLVVGNIGPMEPISLSVTDARILATSSSGGGGGGRGGSDLLPLLRLGTATFLGYSTLLNGTIAILFKMKRGMGMLGKDLQKGTIPLWSYLLFSPFHIPTYAYTYVHTLMGRMKIHDSSSPKKKTKKVKVPVASMVQPGFWVGGCFAHQLNKQWAGIIDLTVEFPESCRDKTLMYLCLPTWDGVPCSPEQLEKAANFAVEAKDNWMKMKEQGVVEGEPHILIHCAHGRGRSTTVMCAAMVKMGMYANFEEALEKGIKPGRPVCKLNAMMRNNLTEWQTIYVEGKKGI
jgi:protein-tyrosine phosphatase